jgi:hypothetical protein
MPQTMGRPFMARTMVEAGHRVKVPFFGALPIRAALGAPPQSVWIGYLNEGLTLAWWI